MNQTEALKKYTKLKKYYDFKLIFEYLETLRKTGITNMFGAAPFLYIGKERLEHEFKYKNIPDEEEFEELLDMSEDVKNDIVRGSYTQLQDNSDSSNFIRSVERKVQNDARDILMIWSALKGKAIKENTLIRRILKEEVNRKYNRLTPNQYDVVYKLIDKIFKGLELEWQTKEDTYGDVRINFCRNGKKVGLFTGGDEPGWDDDTPEGTKIEPYTNLMIDKSIINQIQSVFKIRKTLILHMITEFFEDNYLNEVSSKFGIQFDNMEDASEHEFRNHVCNSVLDKGRPNLSREEQLDWIQSTGRGRNTWERKSDKELERSFIDIWRIEKENELKGR